MEYQISAGEFLKKKEKLTSLMILMSLVSPLLPATLGWWLSIAHRWLESEPTGKNVIKVLAAVIVIPILCSLCAGRFALKWRKRFERAHPEMQNLTDWMTQIGSAETYPITELEKAAFARQARVYIEQHAKVVNLAIRIRDLVEKMAVTLTDDAEKRYMVGVMMDLNKRVNIDLEDYNSLFKLLTERQKVLCGPEFDSAKDFREKLIKVAPVT